MKQIFLKVYPNGKTTTNASVLNFDRENKSGEIVIDYSEVSYLDWDKQLDLIFSDGSTAFVVGTGNTLTVPLLESYLKKGSMTVQPIAKRLVGGEVEKAKWQVVALSVRDSLNVLENDVTVTVSIAEQMQAEIDEFKDAEALRVQNEIDRESSEGIRESSEVTRGTNESTRQSNEVVRVNNEGGRVSAESNRVTAEQGRVSAESGRVTAEQGRASAESSRGTAETGRVNAENIRATFYDGFNAQLADTKNKILKFTQFGNILCVGDSITAGQTDTRRYPFWLSNYAPVYNFTRLGVGGVGIDYFVANINLIADISPRPDTALLLIGTNNTDTNLATMSNAYTQLLGKILELGIKPIILTLLPRTDDVNRNALVKIFNNWLREKCSKDYGLQVIDTEQAFLNTDGSVKTGFLNADGLHPEVLGYQALAQRIADNLPQKIKPWKLNGDDNKIVNPTFTIDANANGLADNWTNYASSGVVVSYSLVSHPTDGNWQVISKSGGVDANSLVRIYQEFTGPFTAGDMWEFGVDIDANVDTTGEINAFVSFYNASNGIISGVDLLPRCADPVANTRFFGKSVIPVGTAKYRFTLAIFGNDATNAKFGRVMAKKIY